MLYCKIFFYTLQTSLFGALQGVPAAAVKAEISTPTLFVYIKFEN